VPESESEQREAQVNLTEAAQDLNPISEEPRSSYAQEDGGIDAWQSGGFREREW